jgi:hypothetical protein
MIDMVKAILDLEILVKRICGPVVVTVGEGGEVQMGDIVKRSVYGWAQGYHAGLAGLWHEGTLFL